MDSRIDKFMEIKNSKVGDKIRLFGQRNRFTVRARNERFVILSKNFFGSDRSYYTIIDFEKKWMGPDNLVFGMFDYLTDAEEALQELISGKIEVSRRRGISFEVYTRLYGNL